MNMTVHHLDGMRFLAKANSQTAAVDAAPQDGGGGTAFSAPQLFVAALGACVLEFVANSCRLHGIPLERLSMEAAYEEVPNPRRINVVEMVICAEPDLPESVKRRLLGVARHATLVNTLARPPEVQIGFAETWGQNDEAEGDGGLCP